MENSKWSDREVKKLFSVVEEAKSQNKSLLEAFRIYAKKSGRKPNSVRNFYYQEIEQLKNSSKRADRLGINLENHLIVRPERFTNEQSKALVKEILRKKCLGLSVRKACLEQAGGDLSKMVRLQNKFRNVIKYEKDLYNECLKELREEGLETGGNVVYLKKQEEKRLSDEDVSSLFMGLVKLVKRTAFENAERELYGQTKNISAELRETIAKLSAAEKRAQILKEDLILQEKKNKALTQENLELKTRLAKFMSEKIIKTSNNKNKSLANYLREIREGGREVKTKV